jgi:hypothetical protein
MHTLGHAEQVRWCTSIKYTSIPFLSKRQVWVHPTKILDFYFEALLYNKLDCALSL